MSELLTIGEVARLSGVTAKTIRYYESIGLLPKPTRADNGYRMYAAPTVEELRFIHRARGLGCPLEQVEALLGLWRDPSRTSAQVQALAHEHIQAVEQKIMELITIRNTLRELAERCHGDERPDCPILDNLAKPTSNSEGHLNLSEPRTARK